jgi:TonB family protein
MTRRDISLTIALCASLVLHALLVGSAAEVYTHSSGGRIWLPGFPRTEQLSTLVVELPPPIDPMRRLGGDDRGGEAVDASQGEMPMVAPQASQAQALLSLDPAGPGRIGDDPSDSMLPLGKAGSSASIASPPVPPQLPPEQTMPFGLSGSGGDFVRREIPRPPPSPPAQASAESSGQAGAATAADPAPLGESESDPTTTVGGAVFRHGHMEVRLGRKHKITRPRLSIAARSDLMTRASPVVVLKIRLDPAGNVTHADIYRSSGSIDIDQPVKVAAYNWWFEPLKDPTGRPVNDVILFAIRFM